MTGHDRGLRAVGRVREVRERDSRIGLVQALATVREREQALVELETALSQAQKRQADTLDAFVLSRHLLAAMAARVREASARLDASRTVATEAHSRWQADKARVRAVEHLVEQRAVRRAEEARRVEVRETDDIVGRMHARRAGGTAPTGGNA